MRAISCLSFLLLTCAAIFTAPAQAQDGQRRLLNVKQVPASGRSVRAFVPRGWKIEGQVSGDLNRDGRPDTALQLIQNLPAERPDGSWNERSRALLVVFKRPGGTFVRAGVGPRILYCSTCGGMLSNPGGEGMALDIKNGVLNVSQLSGAREATDLTQRFRYDPKLRRFLLIGEDVNNYDRLDGSSTVTSTNYLTRLRITKKYRVKKEGTDPALVSTQRSRVPARRQFLEEIDYEKRS